MKLNKKEKNYLLSTLFKGYVIQCAICSVLIFGGTFLLGIMAEEILRKYVLYYYLYYRTVYLYIVAGDGVGGGCNRVGWLYYILDIPTFEKSSRLCVRGTGCDRKNVRSECQLH